MKKIYLLKTFKISVSIACLFCMIMLSNSAHPDETKWLSIGSLHSWYSSAGCEREIGRTLREFDQQDGLRWPAQFNLQDCAVAKALWIGTTNYTDPIVNQTYEHKVVHVGPRGLDETSEFMPVEFKLYAKYQHPTVVVDGLLASHTAYEDLVDEIDETMKADRMLYNVVNTSVGITMTRRIYAFSQQYNDNYFIHECTFKNTGIYDKAGNKHNKTLTGVIIFFQFRLAPCREPGLGGLYYMPQSASWGHNEMNHVLHPFYGDELRCFYSWQGLHSKCTFDNIGSPYIAAGGRLGAAQFPGVITLHADKSASDKSDDPQQPFSTPYLDSGADITRSNDQFNPATMTKEYAVMNAGHTPLTHAQYVGSGYPDLFEPISQSGKSQCVGYGPYDIMPGDSIRIVFAEGVSGLSRAMCETIGTDWQTGAAPFTLPDGSTTNAADEFKNAWVFTGIDSILKTFGNAKTNWESGFAIPQPPPPPNVFEVNSGGDRILLDWEDNAESWPNFVGYRVYRAIHKPDTTFDMIFECGPGTSNPDVVSEFMDRTAQRGFDYYYYVTSFDDGTTNISHPGVSLESSLFWTRTIEPAYLRRPAAESMSQIRVVPNPYNIRAKNLQFGTSGPDRIMFLDLPPACTIKIYTERGDLINTIEHTDGSGDEAWESVTSSRQVVVSGVYIAHFKTPDGQSAFRKFVIIR